MLQDLYNIWLGFGGCDCCEPAFLFQGMEHLRHTVQYFILKQADGHEAPAVDLKCFQCLLLCQPVELHERGDERRSDIRCEGIRISDFDPEVAECILHALCDPFFRVGECPVQVKQKVLVHNCSLSSYQRIIDVHGYYSSFFISARRKISIQRVNVAKTMFMVSGTWFALGFTVQGVDLQNLN